MDRIEVGQVEILLWQPDANCLGVNPEIFDEYYEENIPKAKRICADCVVRSECLDWSQATPNSAGMVCAGLTTSERVALR